MLLRLFHRIMEWLTSDPGDEYLRSAGFKEKCRRVEHWNDREGN